MLAPLSVEALGGPGLWVFLYTAAVLYEAGRGICSLNHVQLIAFNELIC
jgi:hypothetical protein